MLKMTLHTFSFKSFTGLPNDTLGMCPNMKANMFTDSKEDFIYPHIDMTVKVKTRRFKAKTQESQTSNKYISETKTK